MESSSAKPDLSQHDKPDNNHDAIKFWTQKEKFQLIQALKMYGLEDIQKVQKYVITKNLEETKAAVEYYSGIALQTKTYKTQKEKERKLTEWEKVLKDNFKSKELKSEIAIAFRMIADLENIPEPQVTEGIDFRQVYHQIANALEGKPIIADPGTHAVLSKCVTETAKASKAFMKTAEARSIIKNLDFSNKQSNMFIKPTENQELALIRHLASQLNYNPLKIPEENLRPSNLGFEHPSTRFETPSTPNFETPSTSYAGTPSTSYAGTPSTSYAGTPSTSYAGTPSTSYAGTPSTSHAKTRSTFYAGTPSTYFGTPLTSFFESPSTSYFESPSTSNVETPSTSNDVLCTGLPTPGRAQNQSKGKGKGKGDSKGKRKGGYKGKGKG